MDQRDRFVAFAQKWGIPKDALEAFLSECEPDSVVTDGGDASETYLGLDGDNLSDAMIGSWRGKSGYMIWTVLDR